MSTTIIGFTAEKISADYLRDKGYRIICQNWRKPWGELDLVAEREGVVIFVEVKASTSETTGFSPELRAGSTKLIKVARTARTYLASNKYPPEQAWQIDIISVVFNKEAKTAKIRHFKNVDI